MPDSHAFSEHQNTFRDPSALTRWTRVFLYVCTASNLVFVGLWALEGAGGAASPVGIVSADRFLPHLLWYYPVQWITAILVLLWTRRANYNAGKLGAAEMEFTPLWAVGSYCVPILWFWTPFQVMKEIWRASSNPSQWRNEPGSPLLGWWWVLWTVAFSAWIADEVLIHMFAEMGGFMGWVGIMSPIFEVPAGLLLAVIVSRVHGRQMEHYRSQAGRTADDQATGDDHTPVSR